MRSIGATEKNVVVKLYRWMRYKGIGGNRKNRLGEQGESGEGKGISGTGKETGSIEVT